MRRAFSLPQSYYATPLSGVRVRLATDKTLLLVGG